MATKPRIYGWLSEDQDPDPKSNHCSSSRFIFPVRKKRDPNVNIYLPQWDLENLSLLPTEGKRHQVGVHWNANLGGHLWECICRDDLTQCLWTPCVLLAVEPIAPPLDLGWSCDWLWRIECRKTDTVPGPGIGLKTWQLPFCFLATPSYHIKNSRLSWCRDGLQEEKGQGNESRSNIAEAAPKPPTSEGGLLDSTASPSLRSTQLHGCPQTTTRGSEISQDSAESCPDFLTHRIVSNKWILY